jgi:hypothetical protein
MATFSGTLKRLRVFLDMGKPPLEIVAYSSALFFPFRLKQNTVLLGTGVFIARVELRFLRSPSAFQILFQSVPEAREFRV